MTTIYEKGSTVTVALPDGPVEAVVVIDDGGDTVIVKYQHPVLGGETTAVPIARPLLSAEPGAPAAASEAPAGEAPAEPPAGEA